jgi:Flp pilus assembly protein TadD
MGKPTTSRLNLIIPLGLAALTLAAFWGVLGCEFVSYDDSKYVVENPHVRGGLTGEAVTWAFTTFHASNWHPLTWLSHALDCQIYQLNPLGHHLTNLLLHIANVLLLFLALKLMTGAMWKSAFVAALFGVHPLHVESVAWVAERKDVLCAFFWMLTLLAYVRHAKSPTAGRYALVVIIFALGLLAKPMLVTLPFVLLLLDYWPLGRFEGFKVQGSKFKVRTTNTQHPTPNTGSSHTRLVGEKVPLIVLSIGSSVMTFLAQRTGGSVADLGGFTVGARIGNAFVSYVGYILKMIWPTRLAVFYPHPGDSLPVWQAVGAALVLALITVSVIRAGGARPYVVVGWLWYVGTLVPVIGFVQVGFQAMADRYAYIPLIGLFVIAAWAFGEANGTKGERGKRRVDAHTRTLAAVGAIILLTLTVFTRIQVGYWRNTFALFEHAIAVTQGNYIAHNNLGQALASEGRFDEAIEHYKKALETDPDPGLAHSNLGAALAELGRFEEAMQSFEHSVRSDPECIEGHVNLGRGLSMQGRFDEATEHLSEALRLDPEHPGAHLEMGNLLGRQGKLDEAADHFAEVIRIKPESAEAHSNLGYVLRRQGKLDEAMSHLQEAVALKPKLGAAHYNLALVLYSRGDYSGAWKEIQLARKCGVNPDPGVLDAFSRKIPEPRQEP